jgi:bifunctional isochorismate lyase/aryl carrier protein
MKEKYFTLKNLHKKSVQLKNEMEAEFNHPKFEFDGKTSALLVIDMQDVFKQRTSHAYIPSFGTIVPGISALISAYSANNRPVVFTRHINTEDDAALMEKWWKGIIRENAGTEQISRDFDTTGHIVIEKAQYDAFYNTELEKVLRRYNVDNLVITGVMTHLCCETTARSAFVRGFKTFFVIDGTATYNESFHRNTVMNLSHGFSVPVLAEEILEKLS